MSTRLIRKSNLSHTIALYLSKNPESPLRKASPKTFHFNCSFADELDELLMDDLYEVEQSFRETEEEGKPEKWWILKAALADKGNGIRLFSTREALEDIFQEFEPESDDDEEDEEEEEDQAEPEEGSSRGRAALFGADTRVDSTQMREWVIQVSSLRLSSTQTNVLTMMYRPFTRSTSQILSSSTRHQIRTLTGQSFTFESTLLPLEVFASTFTTLTWLSLPQYPTLNRNLQLLQPTSTCRLI